MGFVHVVRIAHGRLYLNGMLGTTSLGNYKKQLIFSQTFSFHILVQVPGRKLIGPYQVALSHDEAHIFGRHLPCLYCQTTG